VLANDAVLCAVRAEQGTLAATEGEDSPTLEARPALYAVAMLRPVHRGPAFVIGDAIAAEGAHKLALASTASRP
jgi:hypothetical protein